MKLELKQIQYNAPVTLTFTGAALVALLLGLMTGGSLTNTLFSNYRTSWFDPMQLIRLFTHVLGHVDWEHFASNFLLILLLGPMLEEKYGSRQLTLMILFTALVTGLIHTVCFSSSILGASGIVFMMILLSSFGNAQSGKIPLTLLIVVAVFMGKEIVQGVFVRDNISRFAHILGGLCGGAFGYFAMEEDKKGKQVRRS